MYYIDNSLQSCKLFLQHQKQTDDRKNKRKTELGRMFFIIINQYCMVGVKLICSKNTFLFCMKVMHSSRDYTNLQAASRSWLALFLDIYIYICRAWMINTQTWMSEQFTFMLLKGDAHGFLSKWQPSKVTSLHWITSQFSVTC